MEEMEEVLCRRKNTITMTENHMSKLLKKIIQSLIKEDTPFEDFKRNYCKYSNGYKSYKRY